MHYWTIVLLNIKFFIYINYMQNIHMGFAKFFYLINNLYMIAREFEQ